jgi:hypothetical protein
VSPKAARNYRKITKCTTPPILNKTEDAATYLTAHN